ncbi:hypothetical protein [Haloferula sp. BvORR071]|uniref:hypothetical protein n=1 Tax=Haloferula sp. BvORR071 TaxID=1396141 RepID=UPI0005510FA9|nr:hypothetical protein [Haloferula sp. BvORR071]
MAVIVASVATAVALSPPPAFDLDSSVGEAEQILVGSVDEDGLLSVSEVVAGPVKVGDRVQISKESIILRELRAQAPAGFRVDVVAFLKIDKSGKPASVPNGNGLVGFKDGMAWSHRGSMVIGNLGITRQQFMEDLRLARIAREEREGLLALPRSATRTAKIIEFALKHDPDAKHQRVWSEGAGYHLNSLAVGLKDPSLEDHAEILDCLKRSSAGKSQRVLIDLARLIPLAPESFDAISPFLGRAHGSEVRYAAIWALVRLDSARAIEALLPFVEGSEPQLFDVLGGLEPESGGSLNSAVIPPLSRLATEIKGADKMNEEGALFNRMIYYAHPKFVPALLDRASSSDRLLSVRALHALKEMTGADIPADDLDSWRAWWKRFKPELSAGYDLTSESGCAAWSKAWAHGDPAVRKLLVQLWLYEKEINVAWLAAAAGADPAASRALAELRRWDRLPAERR